MGDKDHGDAAVALQNNETTREYASLGTVIVETIDLIDMWDVGVELPLPRIVRRRRPDFLVLFRFFLPKFREICVRNLFADR